MQIEMQDVVEKRIPPDADRPIRPEARVDRRNGRADSDSLLRPFATHPSSHECNLLPPANTEDADPPPVILGPVLHVTTALTREDLRSHEYDRPTERAQCLSQRHAELNLADPVAGSDESITGRCCRRTPGQRPDQQDGKRNYRRGAHAAQIMARRGRPVNNASEHPPGPASGNDPRERSWGAARSDRPRDDGLGLQTTWCHAACLETTGIADLHVPNPSSGKTSTGTSDAPVG